MARPRVNLVLPRAVSDRWQRAAQLRGLSKAQAFCSAVGQWLLLHNTVTEAQDRLRARPSERLIRALSAKPPKGQPSVIPGLTPAVIEQVVDARSEWIEEHPGEAVFGPMFPKLIHRAAAELDRAVEYSPKEPRVDLSVLAEPTPTFPERLKVLHLLIGEEVQYRDGMRTIADLCTEALLWWLLLEYAKPHPDEDGWEPTPSKTVVKYARGVIGVSDDLMSKLVSVRAYSIQNARSPHQCFASLFCFGGGAPSSGAIAASGV